MKITKSTLKTAGLLCSIGLLPTGVFAQGFNATGTVTDENGDPIPGASIRVKGTSQGIMTDVDGNFSIKCDKGATLIVSFVGYENQVVEAGSQLTIEMQEDRKMLDDVVVIGYGTQRKEAVTGSVASVSAGKLMENPSSNVTQSLQNRIAGVDLQQTNSQPGAELRIRIRGQRSLNASNDPLIVLDGIPFTGTLSDINPSDIKSMDILKDASSTAIYGSRGANGVIMITTNKGNQGAPAKVTYNGYVGFKTLFSEYPMMNGNQLGKLRDLAGKYPVDGPDEKRGTNTNWQDKLFQTGISNSHDITVNGGTNGGSYSFGIGYMHDEGVVPTQEFNRVSLRASIDQKVGKYIRLGLTTTNSFSSTHGTQIGIYSALSASPLLVPNDENGNAKERLHSADDYLYPLTKDKLEELDTDYCNQTRTAGSFNNFFAELSIPGVEGLKYRVNLGLNYRGRKQGNFTGKGVNDGQNPNTVSSAATSSFEERNWAVENLLTYDRTFDEKHEVNLVALFSQENTYYSSMGVSGRNIPNPYHMYYNIGNAIDGTTVSSNNFVYQDGGLESLMFRAMYSYDSRYMLSVAMRRDGSSRLASGHKWHTYPAVSVGWNVNKESFMSDFDMIDQLKLRFGYGQTANAAIDYGKVLGRLGTVDYNFGSTYATGYYITEPANKELGWEYSKTFNYGVDFSLYNGRVNGTLEYYSMKTEDLLLSRALPGTSGVSSQLTNIGATENKGFEATVNGIIFENKNGWTWEAGFNISLNRNKLTKLTGAPDEEIIDPVTGKKTYRKERNEGNGWFVGHPIDVIYDYVYDGLWNQGDKDFEHLNILEPGGNEGMIKVKYNVPRDEKGTPTRAIGPDDRQIISMEPKFIGGFNTRVAWKNIDLNIIGAFQCGGKIISTLYSGNGYLNMLSGRRGNVDVDYWTESNKGAKYPKPGGITSGDNPKYASTLGVFDGGYCKIRTITLGYNFDKKLLKNIGVTSARVYGTIQNPFVISSEYYKESGMDPEPNSMSNQGQYHAVAMGGHAVPVIGTNAPATRNYLIGLNVTF
jgi:TonB-linked SusC/RagA family outer membrane protein